MSKLIAWVIAIDDAIKEKGLSVKFCTLQVEDPDGIRSQVTVSEMELERNRNMEQMAESQAQRLQWSLDKYREKQPQA